mgnify:CR=1 FL=1
MHNEMSEGTNQADAGNDRVAVLSTRRQRFAAFWTLATSSIVMGILLERVTDVETWIDQPRSLLVLQLVGIVVAFNIWVFGLLWLAASLKDQSLFGSAHGLKGFLRKLAGSNTLGLMFVAGNLQDFGPVRNYTESLDDLQAGLFWSGFLVLFFLMIRQGVRLLHRGFAADAISADVALQTDARKPIVYIRSFMLDGRLEGLYTAFTVEQEVCEVMRQLGPIVAIGKPGEPFPELGAARVYTSDEEWQGTIIEYFNRANYVVVQAGPTANLWWEIDEARKRIALNRLLILLVGKQSDTVAFDQALEARFGPISKPSNWPIHAVSPAWSWLAPGIGVELGRIIHFLDGTTPKAESISYPINLESILVMPFIAAYRPFLLPIRRAFTAVFEGTDVQLNAPKSQFVAILLSMYGGLFGLQHFYLGNKSAGWKSVAFWWTTIPMILGWIESVKMTRMDDREFEQFADGQRRRYCYPSQAK